MKQLIQVQKLSRQAQKTVMGQALPSCPPTGCYVYSVKDGNNRCFVLPCHTVYGTVQLVEGKYQCCF